MPLDFVGLAPEVFAPPVEETDTTLKVLRRAYQLIDRGWCRHTNARFLISPAPVSPKSKFATRFCAQGAIIRAAWELGTSEIPANDELRGTIGKAIPTWNDNNTKAGVLLGFERAITRRKRAIS